MSQHAQRSSAPPFPSEPREDLPESRAPAGSTPLAALLEEVRGPGMTRADIDVFVAALERPLSPDESPRARADLLLGLMQPANPVGDYRGPGGKKVRDVARESLLSLGYPYALELPPELLPAPSQRPPGAARRTRAGWKSALLLLVSTLSHSVVLLLVDALFFHSSGYIPPAERTVSPLFLPCHAFVWLTLVCSLSGHVTGNRALQVLGSIGLWLQAAVWVALALVLGMLFSPGFLVVVPWHLTSLTAYVMRPTPRPDSVPAAPTAPPVSTP